MNITDKMILSAFRTAAVFALANMGASFVDGLVTSHYLGSAEMAAVGLASPFFTISSTLCTCIGTGMTALCAHNLGSGNKDTLNKYFNNALWTMLIVSVVLMAAFLFGAEPIAALLGARDDAALLKNASAYMRGLALGLPTFLLSGAASQAIQMDGGGELVKISAVCCLIADAVFDVLAVLFGWGLFGIGLATSVSTLVKFCILFSHFFRRKSKALQLQKALPDFFCIFRMIRSGSDTLTLSAINIVKPILLNALILSAGGSAALSVMSVYNNLNGFLTVICSGLSSALSITVGMLYGEVSRRDIVHTAGFVQKLVLIMYAPVILLLILFSGPIAQYYLPDAPELWQTMRFALYCLSFCLIAYSMIFLRIRYLQTVNRIPKAQVLTFLANFAAVLLCAYLASIPFGVYGILASNAISSAVCILGIVITAQLRSRKFFVTHEDYLCLSPSFYSSQEAHTEISLKSTDCIKTAVSVLTDFCEKYAGGSNSLSLCAERMLNLRLAAAKSQKNARYDLNIRAEIRDDACRLIIRDDGEEHALSAESLTDALNGLAAAPYAVNLHRVLDCNSMILEMNA